MYQVLLMRLRFTDFYILRQDICRFYHLPKLKLKLQIQSSQERVFRTDRIYNSSNALVHGVNHE